MNTLKNQDTDEPLPPRLKYISFGLSIALVALAFAVSGWWFPDHALAKLLALLICIMAAPPISFVIVLEVANRVSRGDPRPAGKLKP